MKCANTARAKSAFSSAIKKVKPTPSETGRDFAEANKLISKLERVVPYSVEVRLAGSLAKGTDLKGKNEFDIFVLFPRHYHHHEMTMLGLSYARRAFHGMRMESRYAEHPYLQVFSGDYHADIVPAYRISGIEEKGSSVDRSQLHTEYVNAKLDAKGKDDVRLLKRFMKNFGIYGAELRVEGFSGYLCELLVIHYGSLLSLMEAASDWKEPAIDTALHHRGEHRKLFQAAPLVVIDPVDPHRNVAAVVSRTSLSRFIFECRRFLKNPSEKFFFSEKKRHTLAETGRRMRERGTACLMLAFRAPEVVPDVLWPQLKKTAQALSKRLTAQGFSIFGSYHWSDGKECAVLFEIDSALLPAVRKVEGPSVGFASDVDAFVKKHSNALNIHLEHDRIVAVEKREVRRAEKALLHACKNPKGLGVPENMEKALARFEVLEGAGMLKARYLEMLADYFFAKIA